MTNNLPVISCVEMKQISPCVTVVWHSRDIPYKATHYEGLMEYKKPLWEHKLPSFCGKTEMIQKDLERYKFSCTEA